MDGLLHADSTAVLSSLLHSCLPLQSCLQGLAEGLAAWLCYLAVIGVDIFSHVGCDSLTPCSQLQLLP